MTRRRRRRDDCGFTILEVVLAMCILGVAIAVFGTALKIMTSATSRISAAADGSTAARGAGDLLGRQLGVASAANTPVRVGPSWYLEFATDAVKAGAEPQCTQWRYQQATRLVEYRTWGTVTLTTSGWVRAASSVVNDPSTQPPFTLYPPDAGFKVMRVLVDLRVQPPGGPALQSQGQYTLRNSLDAPIPTASTVCTQLGRP